MLSTVNSKTVRQSQIAGCYRSGMGIKETRRANLKAIAEADTLLLTVPNTLGVEYNTHVIESILRHVAPALGWR